MAVIITRENKVIEYNPAGKMPIDEISNVIGIDVYSLTFTSDSPYCIVASSIDANAGINSIASLYCEKPIYGDALFMSGSELRSTKKTLKYINEKNSMFSTKEFNAVMLNAFKNAIVQINEIYNTDRGLAYNGKKQIFLDIQELYYKLFDEEEDDVMVKKRKENFSLQDYENILEKAYNGLYSHGNIIEKQNCVLFHDDECNVMLNPDKAEETVCFLLGYFVDKEEYEKCVYLRDVKFI